MGEDGANGRGEELSSIFLLCDGGEMTFSGISLSSSEPCLSEDAGKKMI